MTVLGYVDRPSAEPGSALQLHVRADGERWTARVVRLHALEIPSADVERREQPVEQIAPIERPAIEQLTPVGSYVRADIGTSPDLSAGLTITVLAMPTRPGVAEQAIVAGGGWALGLDADGNPTLWVDTDAGQQAIGTGTPLVRGCWTRLTAVVDSARGELRIAARPSGTLAANRVMEGAPPARAAAALTGAPRWVPAPLLLGAARLEYDRLPRGCFDGRIEAPAIIARAVDDVTLDDPAIVAAWDFAHGTGERGFARPSHVHDGGPHGRHGRAVNHPTRAIAGHAFTGDRLDFRAAPEQYAAMHFHSDAMTDCGWTPQAKVAIPADAASGVYALRLESDGASDLVPFVVRPGRDQAPAPILLVLSTNSYLAYANDHVAVDSPRVQAWTQMVPALDDVERLRYRHRELGGSLYESYVDGAGVCHSSWRRPILTMRPHAYNHNGPVWQFQADMQIVDWLDRTGRRADVVCDHDVHEQGAALLGRYRCVLTGSHPEYVSGPMLDAYEAYVAGGGRLAYLGGNGMYWVTAYDPEDPQVIEIRRASGTQAWAALPGEHHLSFTGEPGGTWRSRRRAPQKSFGVGFVAHGNPAAAAGYRRVVADDSPAAWVFAGTGVAANGDFGAYGIMGGAAGIEVDAVDPELGTPAGTIVLATSFGHGAAMVEARENFNMTHTALGADRNPRVRSDMVLAPRGDSGAVFATGSIGWVSSLSHAGGDNEIARVLANVIDRFSAPGAVLD
jgi:N,N-dimethylformamidase